MLGDNDPDKPTYLDQFHDMAWHALEQFTENGANWFKDKEVRTVGFVFSEQNYPVVGVRKISSGQNFGLCSPARATELRNKFLSLALTHDTSDMTYPRTL